MIINSGSLAALFTGFKANFQSGFAGAKPAWNKVSTLVPSGNAAEDYAWLGSFPQLREWIGDRVVKNLQTSSYSIRNKKFESTVAVQRPDIERDNIGLYAALMEQMGYAAAVHPDKLVFALLAAGFATNCYDGQYFFDSDHPVGSGTVSNTGGGSGASWFLLDTSRPLKPLIFQREKDYKFVSMQSAEDEGVFMRDEYRYGVDSRGAVGFGFWQMAYGSKDTLNSTNFDAGVAAMGAFKDDEGNPLGVIPTLLVCGPSNRAAGRALIEAEKLASGADNTNYKAVELYVCPWLT